MQTDPSISASTPGSAWASSTSFTPAGSTAAGAGGAGSPAARVAPAAAAAARPGASTTRFVTGAYQPSGDHGIDRMIELERALKFYGSPF